MKKKLKQILIIILLVAMPVQAKSAMKSTSYVIHENVMHNFDGPVISAVSDNVSGITVSVDWNTDVTSDAFVIYDTDAGFGSTHEQGNSSKSGAAHSINLSGLSPSTTYYYRVRSERVNGGVTTDMTVRSFTTGADPNAPEPNTGGGILIIDKTDKTAPEITEVKVNVLENGYVEIGWKTDEDSTSFIEFGYDNDYGTTIGNWDMSVDHKIVLDTLKEGRNYHFRSVSSDDWGNIGYSEDGEFLIGEEKTEEEIVEEDEAEENGQSIVEDAKQKALEFFKRLFPEVALNDLGEGGLSAIEDFDDLENFMPVPILSGEPRVEIGATFAKVFWMTDTDSTSQVAVASEREYNAELLEPYNQVVGSVENLEKEHEVRVYNLRPDTLYHYQLRSKGKIGPTAKSRDFTFRTSIEELLISSFFSKIIDNETAEFKWVTNKKSNSEIKFIPYHGDTLAYDESKVVKNNEESVIHEIVINEFQAGIFYDIEIISEDEEGNRAIEVLRHFSTVDTDEPPLITQIKADSTIFIDQSNKIQTVISWMTNEPATSQIYFEEGVHSSDEELKDKTKMNTSYKKEHVIVIPKFQAGKVYSFRVESIDSGGNLTTSKVHTFMTAKQKESIIQIIMRILEDTFGWMKNIK